MSPGVPESLEQLLDALLLLGRRIEARTATGGTDAGTAAGLTPRCIRSDVHVDASPIAH